MVSEISCVPSFKDRAFLHQKYVVERLPPAEIGRLIFSSRTTVTKYLKRLGIPLRKGDEAKTRSQLGYGQSWRERRVLGHMRELKVITRMRRLRADGLSYWKIADVLNAWDVPTKTRKGKWSAKTVHQILKRLERDETADI